jgi:hypothetical protein
VEFDARKDQLQYAARYQPAQSVVERGLPDQQEMLDVMPELNDKGCRPPLQRIPVNPLRSTQAMSMIRA